MRRPWILLLVLPLVGCASLPGRSRPATTSRVPAENGADEVTKATISQLQRQAAMAEAEIKLLRRQLAALGVEVERLSSQAEAPPARPEASYSPPVESAPIDQRVDRIETSDLEPVRVAPRVDAPSAPPSSTTEVPPIGVDSAGSPARPAPALGPAATVPPAGQTIYDRGYTLYHQGRYVDAETSFQRFLQAHGNTDLADNAQFWIGESRFARDDYMGALLAFQEVLDVYPSGNKVADALLKTGDCLVELDNRESGRQRYEEVQRRFPGSAAAAMAEERLNRAGG